MKVERLSRYVVTKNKQYLMAIPYYCTMKPRWSNSPYDAIRIKDEKEAQIVAKKVGGNVHKFNPIVGEVV